MRRHHHGLAWPRLDPDERVACHFCDAVQPAPRLREGQRARCGHCGEILYENRPRSLARATGFSSAALIFLVLANAYPVLTMAAAGSRTELTLLGASRILHERGETVLALLSFVFTLIAPAMLIIGLLYLCAPLRHGRTLPGAATLARWMQRSEPWSMLEVFLLGFIVSLLKLGSLAELTFGTGLWALGATVLCIAGAMGGIDRRELWDRLELARARSAS